MKTDPNSMIDKDDKKRTYTKKPISKPSIDTNFNNHNQIDKLNGNHSINLESDDAYNSIMKSVKNKENAFEFKPVNSLFDNSKQDSKKTEINKINNYTKKAETKIIPPIIKNTLPDKNEDNEENIISKLSIYNSEIENGSID